MRWTTSPHGTPIFESDRGHTWFLEKQWDSRAHLILVSAPNHRGARKEIRALECASSAEAEIMVACLEYADDVACPDANQMLTEAGFIDGGKLDRDLSKELMAGVLDTGPNPQLYVHGKRRWYGTDDGQLQVAFDPENHFPLYCFSLDSDRWVRPDLLLCHQYTLGTEPKLATKALFGYLEILKLRLELNGSRYSPLVDDQQFDLVNRFEAAVFESDSGFQF